MTVLKIIPYPNEIYRKQCTQVKEIDNTIIQKLDNLTDTMKATKCIGLAANQIGYTERLIVIDKDGDIYHMINPEIISASEEKSSEDEGNPIFYTKKIIYTKIERPLSIKLQYTNIHNEKVIIEADNMFARTILHEIDHLNGILIIDRISTLKRNLFLSKVKKSKGK